MCCIHCCRGQPQLVENVWPGQTAMDSAAGFSLVRDGDGSVTLPACERKLEGRGQQGFEGAEKTLEIEFDPDIGHEDGLRAIRKEQWDAVLQQVLYGGCACLRACSFFRSAWASQCERGLAVACVFRRHVAIEGVPGIVFVVERGALGAPLSHPDLSPPN